MVFEYFTSLLKSALTKQSVIHSIRYVNAVLLSLLVFFIVIIMYEAILYKAMVAVAFFLTV